MYKYILATAGDINWMALLSLLTFVFVFVTSAILALRKNNEQIKHMSHLPLEDDHSEFLYQ